MVELLESKVRKLEDQGWGNNRGVQRIEKRKPPNKYAPGPITGREARWSTWAFDFAGFFDRQCPGGEAFLEWVKALPRETEVDRTVLEKYDRAHPEGQTAKGHERGTSFGAPRLSGRR